MKCHANILFCIYFPLSGLDQLYSCMFHHFIKSQCFKQHDSISENIRMTCLAPHLKPLLSRNLCWAVSVFSIHSTSNLFGSWIGFLIFKKSLTGTHNAFSCLDKQKNIWLLVPLTVTFSDYWWNAVIRPHLAPPVFPHFTLLSACTQDRKTPEANAQLLLWMCSDWCLFEILRHPDVRGFLYRWICFPFSFVKSSACCCILPKYWWTVSYLWLLEDMRLYQL